MILFAFQKQNSEMKLNQLQILALKDINLNIPPTESFFGGVALYIKESFDYKLRDDLSLT